jgi:protein import protein ZIM17
MTIEDLMREQGQLVKKGMLSENGDLEFWSDGSTTKRGEGAGVGVGANESVEGEGEVLPEEKSNPGSV